MKKIFTSIVVLILIFMGTGTIGLTATSNAISYEEFDLNSDGVVDVFDVIVARQSDYKVEAITNYVLGNYENVVEEEIIDTTIISSNEVEDFFDTYAKTFGDEPSELIIEDNIAMLTCGTKTFKIIYEDTSEVGNHLFLVKGQYKIYSAKYDGRIKIAPLKAKNTSVITRYFKNEIAFEGDFAYVSEWREKQPQPQLQETETLTKLFQVIEESGLEVKDIILLDEDCCKIVYDGGITVNINLSDQKRDCGELIYRYNSELETFIVYRSYLDGRLKISPTMIHGQVY